MKFPYFLKIVLSPLHVYIIMPIRLTWEWIESISCFWINWLVIVTNYQQCPNCPISSLFLSFCPLPFVFLFFQSTDIWFMLCITIWLIYIFVFTQNLRSVQSWALHPCRPAITAGATGRARLLQNQNLRSLIYCPQTSTTWLKVAP